MTTDDSSTRVEAPEEPRTRERLLAEAEKVFAVHGYDGASVREITTAADANVAAVSYYFGGKEGLYRAVFERFFDEMRERRILRIEADLEAAGGELGLEDFLESFAAAFIEPLVEGERGRHFIAMFDQEMRLEKMPREAFFERLVEPMLRLFVSGLGRVGVVLEAKVAGLCLMSIVGQLIHVLKVRQRFSGEMANNPLAVSPNEMIPHVVRFSAAGIRAYGAPDDGQKR